MFKLVLDLCKKNKKNQFDPFDDDTMPLLGDEENEETKTVKRIFEEFKDIKYAIKPYKKWRDSLFFAKKVHQEGKLTFKKAEQNLQKNIFYIEKISIIIKLGILIRTPEHFFLCWYSLDGKYISLDFEYWRRELKEWVKNNSSSKHDFRFIYTNNIAKDYGKRKIYILVK